MLRIIVYDEASGPWGHINVDDFRLTDTNPATETFRAPAGRALANFDVDAPVRGSFDPHTHPLMYQGCGGLRRMSTMWGSVGTVYNVYVRDPGLVRLDLPACDGARHAPRPPARS